MRAKKYNLSLGKKDVALYNTVYYSINMTIEIEVVSPSLKELSETYAAGTIRYSGN